MTDDAAGRTTPIYASYLTFVTLLDWLQDTKHIPSEFDRSFWTPKFSGTTGAQLIAGLKFLRLLDAENRPTDRLEPLALASSDDRPKLIGQMLREVYGADLVDGLQKMTTKMLSDRLSALGTTDATHTKAIAFFVNAAKAANVPMPGPIAKKARNRPAGAPRKTTRVRPPAAPETPAPASPASPTASLPSGLHSVLLALLTDLQRIGPSWDQETSEGWKVTWDQSLKYAYPVKAGSQEDASANK